MAKFFLIMGFMLALSALGFAAANAGGPPAAPERAIVNGHAVDIDYN